MAGWCLLRPEFLALTSHRHTLISSPSLSFLPMNRKTDYRSPPSPRDSPRLTESPNRCSSGHAGESSEPSESSVYRIPSESSDFESGKPLSAPGAVDSPPTTADRDTRLPCDPADASEMKRWQTGGTWFRLTDECLLALHRGDITKWSVDGKTDAIVNAANQGLLGGGGVDGAIHRAAGPGLYEACHKLHCIHGQTRCRTGEAVITSGFQLPVHRIIHAVGPIFEDKETSAPLLEKAYKNAIAVAVQNNVKYLSFPAISCGVYGYPYDQAAEIALRTVQNNAHPLKEIHFVLFEEGPWQRWLSIAHQRFEKVLYDQ